MKLIELAPVTFNKTVLGINVLPTAQHDAVVADARSAPVPFGPANADNVSVSRSDGAKSPKSIAMLETSDEKLPMNGVALPGLLNGESVRFPNDAGTPADGVMSRISKLEPGRVSVSVSPPAVCDNDVALDVNPIVSRSKRTACAL